MKMTKKNDFEEDPIFNQVKKWLDEGWERVKQQRQEWTKEINGAESISEFKGINLLETVLDIDEVNQECRIRIYESYARLFPYDPEEIIKGYSNMEYEDPADVRLDLKLIAREYNLNKEIERQISYSIPKKIKSELECKYILLEKLDKLTGNYGIDFQLAVQLISVCEPIEKRRAFNNILAREPRFYLHHILQEKIYQLKK